jgi:hypothetical protein
MPLTWRWQGVQQHDHPSHQVTLVHPLAYPGNVVVARGCRVLAWWLFLTKGTMKIHKEDGYNRIPLSQLEPGQVAQAFNAAGADCGVVQLVIDGGNKTLAHLGIGCPYHYQTALDCGYRVRILPKGTLLEIT